MLSSMEVVFFPQKNVQIVLSSTIVDLKLLESSFSHFMLFQAVSCYFQVIFHWGPLPWRSSSVFSKFLILFWVLINLPLLENKFSSYFTTILDGRPSGRLERSILRLTELSLTICFGLFETWIICMLFEIVIDKWPCFDWQIWILR
jgi:hypothetical protein